ncbi:unnamed protein product [Adineta steineri]|uniref:Uncharacterized protein n=2 Tax=Adineta steineri TaxID=433720 RepID=A0A813PC12_9BILA|nr:unnamed protein product [Adineta steineri]
MSNICEHPFCTRFISRKCLNHCQLDLCDEHLTEHKNLFFVQYEKSFNNLTKSFDDLTYLIEETKNKFFINYQNDISLINENYRNKLNEIEDKSSLIISTENLIKKKLQLLSDVKNNQAFLYQYDIEQIKLYSNKIHETNIAETLSDEMFSLSPSSDDDDDYSQVNNKKNDISFREYRGICPLAHYGVYGLNNKHNIRLCSHEKDKVDRNLYSHFHHYHHLTNSLSSRLTKAVIDKLNPLTTYIFPSEQKITDKRYDMIECPLDKAKLSICKRKFLRQSLKTHLLRVHHLTLETSNKILDNMKKQGDLTKIDFDEDEFK